MIRRANVVGVPIGVPVFNSQASGTDAELMRSSQSGYTVEISQSGGHTLLSRSQSFRLQTRLENRLRMAQSSMVFSSDAFRTSSSCPGRLLVASMGLSCSARQSAACAVMLLPVWVCMLPPWSGLFCWFSCTLSVICVKREFVF